MSGRGGREDRGVTSGWMTAGILPWLLVLVAALLPFGNALRCDFAFDDNELVLRNPAAAPDAPWHAPLTEPYWPEPHSSAGLYRPLTSWTYWVQRTAWGDDPVPFHALNLLLHAGVALLCLAVLRTVLPTRPGLALAIALVFAVHPLHTEAVTGIVGRAEILAALCGLAGYALWLRATPARWLPIALLFALACAAKESAVGWLAVLAAHRVGLFGDGRAYRIREAAVSSRPARGSPVGADMAVLVGIIGYMVVRLLVLGSLVDVQNVSAIENPVFAAPLGVRLLTAIKVLGLGLGLMILPLRLCADYSYRTVTVEEHLFGVSGPVTLLLLVLAVAALAGCRRWPGFTWSLAVYAALIAPVANLLLPIGTIMAERLLYLPSLGILAAALLLVRAGLARMRLLHAAPILLVILLVLYGARTWQRNLDWRNDRALFEATVATAPENAKAHINLGGELVRAGEIAAAEGHYLRSLEITPDYLPGLTGLGHVRILQARFADAEELLARATTLYPLSYDAWIRYGNLLLEVERPDEGHEAFGRAIALHADRSAGWVGRASALFMLERFAESADAWQRAQDLAPGSEDYRRHLATALHRAGRSDEAAAILGTVADEQRGEIGPVRDLVTIHLERGDCDSARAVLSSNAGLALTEDDRRELEQQIASRCNDR